MRPMRPMRLLPHVIDEGNKTFRGLPQGHPTAADRSGTPNHKSDPGASAFRCLGGCHAPLPALMLGPPEGLSLLWATYQTPLVLQGLTHRSPPPSSFFQPPQKAPVFHSLILQLRILSSDNLGTTRLGALSRQRLFWVSF